MIYPSEWFGGKHTGSINERDNTFLVRVPVNGSVKSKYFSFTNNNKNEKYNDAVVWRNKISLENGLTKNLIRYIDKDTVEVMLGNGDSFFTDSVFINKIEEHKIYVKKCKGHGYVVCQEKKDVFNFATKICTYKNIEHIDKNSMNLRLSNLKELGSIIAKDKDKQDEDIYQYSKLEKDNLPKNKWILGKISGSIFKKKDDENYTVAIKDDNGIMHSKTFDPKKYASDKEAYEEAKKWQYNSSYKLNLTKNMIKILDDEYIMVQLSNGKEMITDFIFLDFIQNVPLFSTRTSNKNPNAKHYCGISYNNELKSFHSAITGFSMVDHINHNPLDNRLINLRCCSISENNKNRTTDNELYGIRLQSNSKREWYQVRSKFNKNLLTKNFEINKTFHKDKAKKLAKRFRKYICEVNVNSCKIKFTKQENIKELGTCLENLEGIKKQFNDETITDINDYIKHVDFDKVAAFEKYTKIQNWRIKNISMKIKRTQKQIKRLIAKRGIKNKYYTNDIDIRTDYSVLDKEESDSDSEDDE